MVTEVAQPEAKERRRRKRVRRGGLSPVELLAILKVALNAWWDDNVPRMGAALAYYTLIALAPVLVVAISLGGMMFGADAVRGEIVGQIDQLVGKDGAQAVQSMLEAAANSPTNIPAAVIGGVTFFLGATGAFLELQTDLDAIWRVKPRSRGSFLRDLVMQRMISFGLVLGFAFLLLTSLVVSAGLAGLHTYMGNSIPGIAGVWETVNAVVSLAVITLLFAMIYKVLPDVKLAWADVWVGSLVTAGLFTVGKFVIGLYLGASSFSTTYGVAGSVIVVLVWVYYSSQVVLLGAEFTRAYVEHFGARPPPADFAVKDPDAKA